MQVYWKVKLFIKFCRLKHVFFTMNVYIHVFGVIHKFLTIQNETYSRTKLYHNVWYPSSCLLKRVT